MPPFNRAELDAHIIKSGKIIDPQSQGHSVPTGLQKAKVFLVDEYLKQIEVASDNSYFYFKSFCYHSFKKNEAPHKLRVALDLITGEVKEASCTCVAGKVGLCNHVLALMLKLCKFTLHACSDTKQLDSEDDMNPTTTCTSSLQLWHKKGRGDKITPKPIMEVLVKKTKLDDSTASTPIEEGLKCLLYEARNNLKSQAEDEVKLKADLMVINPSMPLAQILNTTENLDLKETKFGKSPSGSFASYQLQFTESNFKVFCDLGPIPTTPQDVRDPPTEYPKFPLNSTEPYKLPDNLEQQEVNLLTHLLVDVDKLNDIEKKTRSQSTSDEWKNERQKRITASNFKKVCIRQRNHESLVNSLINPTHVYSKYTEHGKRYEPIALRQYQKYMYSIRRPVVLFKSGLVVAMDAPFLGASPDSKVIEVACENQYGLVEIKCPHTKFHVTPLEACSDKTFFCEEIDGKPKLKDNHDYYFQVQGQLGVTKAMWCDFVVYTNAGMSIQRIPFNGQFWGTLKEKLKEYYFKHFLKIAAEKFCNLRQD